MAEQQSNKRGSTANKGGKAAAPAAEQDKQAKAEAEAKAAEQEKEAEQAAAAKTQEQDKGSDGKDADPAKDAGGGVRLEVSTRQPKRVRAGVTVTRQPSEVSVTEDQAARLEADRHIRVKRL